MEHSVQLGTQNYRDSICECLCELRDQEQLPLQIVEERQGKHWLIQCKFEDPSLEESNDDNMVQKIHRYYLASALAETILQQWEKEHVRKVVMRKRQLIEDNGQKIINNAINYLNKGLGQVKGYRVSRKTKLVSQILSCLDHNPVFEIEGFLDFRAQDYKKEVNKAVEFAINEYVVEKEYVEFIQLLKHFVDSQAPRLECLHVGVSSQGKFHLYNDKGIEVTHQFLEDYQLENLNELGYEDLVVSSLIAVAPRQVILHIRYDGYKDTLQTIRNVFGDRVRDCQGCSLCKSF